MYMKFATGSGGFESDLNFEPSEKFPWGPPLAEFWKLWGSIARQQVNSGSEEHTSELQSRETISYAVFCLKKKKKNMIYEKQSTEHYMTLL